MQKSNIINCSCWKISSARSNYSGDEITSLSASPSIILFVLGDAIPVELLERYRCECSLNYFKREIRWQNAKAFTYRESASQTTLVETGGRTLVKKAFCWLCLTSCTSGWTIPDLGGDPWQWPWKSKAAGGLCGCTRSSQLNSSINRKHKGGGSRHKWPGRNIETLSKLGGICFGKPKFTQSWIWQGMWRATGKAPEVHHQQKED